MLSLGRQGTSLANIFRKWSQMDPHFLSMLRFSDYLSHLTVVLTDYEHKLVHWVSLRKLLVQNINLEVLNILPKHTDQTYIRCSLVDIDRL